MPKTKARDKRIRQEKARRAEGLGEKVLVLNASYQPINQTTAVKAIHLVAVGKAEIVSNGGSRIASINEVYDVPAVIRVKRYIKVPDPLAVWGAEALLYRDGYVCQYCGKQLDPKARRNSDLMPTVDHIIPKHLFADKTKASTWTNTCCSCSACNKRKGGKTMKEAGMRFYDPNFEPKRPRSDFLRRTDEMRPEWREWIPLRK